MIGVILAGGQARRFAGAVKPLLEVDRRTIFDRQCEVLRGLCDAVVVAAQQPAAWANVPVVQDQFPDGGPLAGVHAGVRYTRDAGEPWCLVVAGDMPHLRADVLQLLLTQRDARAHEQATASAIAFELDGRPQPLCTLFHVSALTVLERRLAAGQGKVAAALLDPAMTTQFVREAAVRALDPTLASFHNVNSPADMPAATHAHIAG